MHAINENTTKNSSRLSERQFDRFEKSIASRITQLRTGHGYMNTYLRDIGSTNSEKCSCGANKQNTEHILLSCRKYSVQRKTMKEILKQRLSVHALLYTERGIRATADFLRTTDAVRRFGYEDRMLTYGWGRLNEEENE